MYASVSPPGGQDTAREKGNVREESVACHAHPQRWAFAALLLWGAADFSPDE